MSTGAAWAGSRPRPGLLHSADGTVAPVRTTSFDVGAFVRTAFGDRAETEQEVSLGGPPPTAARRVLTYLWAVERSATDTLRRVLATATSREARYTAFLTTWAHDRYWFADRLARALTAAGARPEEPRLEHPTRIDRSARFRDLLAQHVDPVWTTLVGEPTTALHATRGLAEESAGLAAYDRLTELAGGTLDAVLAPLVARKQTHRAFFLAEARMRLADDPAAQRLVRALLTRGFHPLRPGLLPARESHAFLRLLLAGGSRRRVVDRADADVRALPGLAGVGPLAAALSRERPLVPPPPAPT